MDVFDDEFHSPDLPLADDLEDKAVPVQALERKYYRYDMVYVSVEQIVHPTFPTRSIPSPSISNVAVPVRSIEVDDGSKTAIVTGSPECNPTRLSM